MERFLDKETQYVQLVEDIKACEKCSLRFQGQHKCPPYGSPWSRIVFVGEAPGKVDNPDLRELPFVGNKSSDLMMDIIYGLWPNGFDDVFVTNAVKCNPPENRQPTEKEVELCKNWLAKELKLVNPKVIVALGRTACAALGLRESVESARLREYTYGKSKLLVAYHPAYVLRNGSKAVDQYKASFKLFKRLSEEDDR